MTAPSYHAPRSLDDALEILGSLGDEATVVAGGQDVVPLMNQGRLAPRHIMDISHLTELRGIAGEATLGGERRTFVHGPIILGALTTYTDVARHPGLGARLPLLTDALRQMGGGPQVRHRGTVGGAVCAAQPVYDLPVCLLALDAVFILAGREGVRRIPASSFFLDAGRTARRPAELLTAIEIPPAPAGGTSAYVKLKFSEGGYTIAGAASVLVRDPDGVCREARLALAAVSRVPQRIPSAESAVVGGRIGAQSLATLGVRVEEAIADPIDDVMAPAPYRRAMAGVMARRAVAQAAAR